MAYYFFVGSTMLPVPPAKMSIKIRNKNKTIDLINEGEVNLIKTPGLTEISFDARLPNTSYPFANYDSSLKDSLVSAFLGESFNFKKADYFLQEFESIKVKNQPVRLIITRMNASYTMLWDTNLLVTLEEYEIQEDAADGFDVTVPLKFKQYRPYSTKEVEVTTDKDGKQQMKVKETRPAPDKAMPAAQKIKNEQSIWELCKTVSGGKLDWRQVALVNGLSSPVITKGMAGLNLDLKGLTKGIDLSKGLNLEKMVSNGLNKINADNISGALNNVLGNQLNKVIGDKAEQVAVIEKTLKKGLHLV